MTAEIAIILAPNSHNNKCHTPGLCIVLKKCSILERIDIQTLFLLDWNFIDRGTLQTPDEGSHSSINPRDVKLIYNQMMVVISGLMIPA